MARACCHWLNLCMTKATRHLHMGIETRLLLEALPSWEQLNANRLGESFVDTAPQAGGSKAARQGPPKRAKTGEELVDGSVVDHMTLILSSFIRIHDLLETTKTNHYLSLPTCTMWMYELSLYNAQALLGKAELITLTETARCVIVIPPRS